MITTVWKSTTFDAAHSLPDYVGPCSNLHGHTYKVELGVSGPIDKKSGMILDMKILKTFLDINVVAKFDHSNLNEWSSLESPSTAENIAIYILALARTHFDLPVKVRVYETATAWVEVGT